MGNAASAIRKLPNAASLMNVLGRMAPQDREHVIYALGASQADPSAQKTSLWNIYYSTIRFTAAITGSGPFSYTVALGTELRAFSYAIGDDLTQATVGFPSGSGSATQVETNLQARAQTVAGERVIIYGISVYLTSDSDDFFTKLLADNVSVVLALNGEQQNFRLGRLGFLPQAGGLNGSGMSFLITPSQLESWASRIGNVTNGLPSVQNFYPLPEPVIWQSAGNQDSTLVVKFKAERNVAISGLAARAASAPTGGSTGAPAFAPPSANVAIGTGIANGTGIVVRLHSQQIAPRSLNA